MFLQRKLKLNLFLGHFLVESESLVNSGLKICPSVARVCWRHSPVPSFQIFQNSLARNTLIITCTLNSGITLLHLNNVGLQFSSIIFYSLANDCKEIIYSKYADHLKLYGFRFEHTKNYMIYCTYDKIFLKLYIYPTNTLYTPLSDSMPIFRYVPYNFFGFKCFRILSTPTIIILYWFNYILRTTRPIFMSKMSNLKSQSSHLGAFHGVTLSLTWPWIFSRYIFFLP
jgi:hypothetical protein